jgi:hypothetical protein
VKASTYKVVALIFVALMLFVAYRANRDTVKVQAPLAPNDVKTIVRGIQEWSSPKLFRQITILTERDGLVSAWVREPGERWSATVFSNSAGTWTKTAWFLVSADHSVIKK